MSLTLSAECVTPAQRIEYAYKAQEELRLLHNKMGKWYREGITKSEYASLPEKIRASLPYPNRLSKDGWDKFKTDVFEPLSMEIGTEICTVRELFKTSEMSVNLEAML